MNVKDIIQSGYLEAYVLGALNEDEIQMIVPWIQVPEVYEYVKDLQSILEYYCGENELTPSDAIREIIFAN